MSGTIVNTILFLLWLVFTLLGAANIKKKSYGYGLYWLFCAIIAALYRVCTLLVQILEALQNM